MAIRNSLIVHNCGYDKKKGHIPCIITIECSIAVEMSWCMLWLMTFMLVYKICFIIIYIDITCTFASVIGFFYLILLSLSVEKNVEIDNKRK